ncbi:hypothetical protein EDD22DRAFT_845644 [Suillus occidentalis]|nr:hypothetical protein EDD22DRAFT_845644 [Suillus occidentalis]
MFANQTSQRRPSGAPINPGQGAAGIDQPANNQQQMADAYRAQLHSTPHLSPLHSVGNNPLPQHDDLFASNQGFPTPSPDLGHLQRFPTPLPDFGRQGFPTPSPDLRRQGLYMYGGGQQQTPAPLSMGLESQTVKSQKKSNGKNISNDHPALKKSAPRGIGAIQPLENGESYETCESGGKTIQVWHPKWLGQVDESFLTLRSLKTPNDSKKAPSEANMSAAAEATISATKPVTEERLNKRRRTTAQNKKLIKKTFDINPDQMNDNPPKSARKNTPFENTVADHWKKTHPDMEMLQGVEWLKGFWGRAQKDDFIGEDWDYLVELKKWHKEQDGDPEMGMSLLLAHLRNTSLIEYYCVNIRLCQD